ncbi:MAG: phosphoribosylformylglycinamidine synthase I [Candidatus Gastranaerophilaceae bacterium]
MNSLKVGIIVFLGTNCEQDTRRACEFFGWDAEYIRQDDKIEKKYDLIFIPGGFSYGDHISSGRIAKLSPAVKSLPVGKTMIVGICNGFQILCEAKLLSGALLDNQNIKFISKVADLDFCNEQISLPIAHHQGNYTDDNIDKNQILMTYQNNENGSDMSIAGIYDRKNKIIGMMPHPERAIWDELGLTDGRKVFEFVKNQI